MKLKIDGAALAAVFAGACLSANAISLDEIQFWTGSGSNRAALVVEWSSPESRTNSSVPLPIADKTLVWGYRFDGTHASGTDMLHAILAADPRLYVVADETYGTFVEAIGYNLSGDGVLGITDGSLTNYFTNGILSSATVNVDAARPINGSDLYWGGLYGPNWEVWNESGGRGGYLASPNRGTNQYWTPTDSYTGYHGQWALAQWGLDDLLLTNGSWIGFSVAAGEYEASTNAASHLHKHAPTSPDGAAVAYVSNTNDFAVEVVSYTGLSTTPYDDANAVLGRPTLKFANSFGDVSNHRVKIVEPAYNKAPDGSKVITKINSGGQITVKLGRKIYDDPNNPYGVDLIVYGNSFFTASGYTGSLLNDRTDLSTAKIPSGGSYGHPTTVSVSQDGVNWYSFPTVSTLFPDNAYRWDDANHSWTDEPLNANKPLNPAINIPAGSTVASALDQFLGACGGTGYDLKAAGLPWIQYVRVEPGDGTYTVIDSIAAVNPVVVGDILSITPGNIASGITNLVFQDPGESSLSLVSMNFTAVSDLAKISTTGLRELSSYAPVTGMLSSGYKLAANPVSGSNLITLTVNLGLRPGSDYAGNGADLLVHQWNGTNWDHPSFTYDSATRLVQLHQLTNLSAFVITRSPPVKPQVQWMRDGVQLRFAPVAGGQYTIERSVDLVQWTVISNITAAANNPVVVADSTAPASAAFYRVRFGR